MQLMRNLAASAIVALVTIMASAARANQVISLSGQLELKSAGESLYRVVGVGTRLIPGDLLRPAADANVTVLCNDSTIWIVPAGIPSGVSNGCPDRVVTGFRNAREWMYPEPGGSNPDIPFTISPRVQSILDPDPLFQWNPVPGASLYLVRVEAEQTVWETTVTDSSVVYPDDAPPLQPGVFYRFTVEADTGAFSDRDLLPNARFILEDESTVARIRSAVAAIQELEMSDEMKGLAIAQLYQENDLLYDAISTLEDLVSAGSENSLVYQRLGILYAHKLGLNLLAESRYTQGIELAIQNQQSHILADCQAGLAAVKIRLGKFEEADRLAQSAVAAYQSLQDSESVELLRDTMDRLNSEMQG